ELGGRVEGVGRLLRVDRRRRQHNGYRRQRGHRVLLPSSMFTNPAYCAFPARLRAPEAFWLAGETPLPARGRTLAVLASRHIECRTPPIVCGAWRSRRRR